MLNAVNIALVGFGRVHALSTTSGEHSGQIFTLMVLAVAAAEAAIGFHSFSSFGENGRRSTFANFAG